MSRRAADEWLTTNGDAIKTAVLGRKSALRDKRYPQVLKTHSDANFPEDDGRKAPDRKSARTSDNSDGFDDLGLNLGATWPCALEINNYGDSKGQGCEYVAYVREGGVLYRKVYKVEGYQQHRLSGWIALEPDRIAQTERIVP